jgi:hypothetical protein
MGVATFTKKGVRYRCATTGKNRWSEGKVHLQFWSKEHRMWVTACRPNDVGLFGGAYHTAEIEPTEVTCKTCKRKDPR